MRSVFTVLLLLVALIAFTETVFAKELRIIVTDRIPKSECLRKTRKGDQISVEYTGYFEDGTVLDSSVGREIPFRFQLGSGKVIKGWELGLLDMCIGESRRLLIPHQYGYGMRENLHVKPGTDLTFDIKLLGIAGYKPDGSPEDEEIEATTASEEGEPETETEAAEKPTEVDAEPTPEAESTSAEAEPVEEVVEAAETLPHDEL
ncbi:hypothetical protein BZA70DRAFT_271123 [Myxozyma melibiosi]|uniref:peptidylprolyl isomerase n=1 Tax=Myxozyma melibiosi TaxID=54550 RepID=A0ABR1FDX8_9ASCO